MPEITYDEFIAFLTVIFKAKRRRMGDCFADAGQFKRMLADPLAWLNHAGLEIRSILGPDVREIKIDLENKTIKFD